MGGMRADSHASGSQDSHGFLHVWVPMCIKF